jgi:hypothetical protein
MPPTPLPPALAPLAAEVATYYRELPRLLADGQAGRFVLVKGDAVVSVWDTSDDAYQAGVSQFGFGPFLAQPIDPRDLDRLAPYFPTPAGSASV